MKLKGRLAAISAFAWLIFALTLAATAASPASTGGSYSAAATFAGSPPFVVTASNTVHGAVDFGMQFASIDNVCITLQLANSTASYWFFGFTPIQTYGGSGRPLSQGDTSSMLCLGPPSSQPLSALFADGYQEFDLFNDYPAPGSGTLEVVSLNVEIWGQASAAPSGEVVAWGADYPGGPADVPSGLTGVVAVSAGLSHSLALKSDGTVVAWGPNYNGQTDVPAGLDHVVAISAGSGHSLALRNNGTVVAWGWNGWGQTDVPPGLTGVIAVAAGGSHSLALKSDGTIVGWGDTWAEGQPAGLTGVTAISAGYGHNLALKADGSVVGWGFNVNAQATPPAGLTGVTAIAAGGYHSLALKDDGTVVAWGLNDNGQASVPVGLTGVTAIAAGLYHSLALKSDGTVVAWGQTVYGNTDVPAGLTNVLAVAGGTYHSLALVGATSDTTPPGISTPGDMTVSATNSTGAVVTFTPTAADAVDGAVPVTCNPPSGSTFPIGDTTVVCSATDAAGNTGTGSFKVSVVDTTPPVVTAPPGWVSVPATSPAGVLISDYVSAVDDVDGPVPVTCGDEKDVFPIMPVGEFYELQCRASDSAGNTGYADNFYIHVEGPSEQVSDLITVVQGYNLGKLGTSLTDKLTTAQRMLDANKQAQAVENLNAFINQLKAQTGKGLTSDQANQLTTDANRIKAVIGL